MSERQHGYGVGFSKEVDAILEAVKVGAAMGDVYIYPHEVRESLRIAGLPLDRNLKKLTPFPTYQIPEFPEGYEPDFGASDEDEDQPEDEGDEPVPAEEEMTHA